jgi:hypothetical protein
MQGHPACVLYEHACKSSRQAGVLVSPIRKQAVDSVQIDKQTVVLLAPQLAFNTAASSRKLCCHRCAADAIESSASQFPVEEEEIRRTAATSTWQEPPPSPIRAVASGIGGTGRAPSPWHAQDGEGARPSSSSEEERVPPLPLGPAWLFGRPRTDSP